METYCFQNYTKTVAANIDIILATAKEKWQNGRKMENGKGVVTARRLQWLVYVERICEETWK